MSGPSLAVSVMVASKRAERERIITLLKAKEQRTDYRGNGPTFSMSEIIRAIEEGQS